MDDATQSSLKDLEQAEKDLRFYTAIIGHRPTVDPNAPPLGSLEPVVVEPQPPMPTMKLASADLVEEEAAFDEEQVAERVNPSGRLSIWIRHLSSNARRRFDEACHRLAS